MKQLKKIELATYDVEEMNRQELMDADGGIAPLAAALLYVAGIAVGAAVGAAVTWALNKYFDNDNSEGSDSGGYIKIYNYEKDSCGVVTSADSIIIMK